MISETSVCTKPYRIGLPGSNEGQVYSVRRCATRAIKNARDLICGEGDGRKRDEVYEQSSSEHSHNVLAPPKLNGYRRPDVRQKLYTIRAGYPMHLRCSPSSGHRQD